MSQIVTFRLRCPVCGLQFGVDEVHDSPVTGRETDFRPLREGPDPLLRNIHCCPGCQYSAYRHGFETERSEEEDLLDDHGDELTPLSLPRGSVGVPDADDADSLRRYTRSGDLTRQVVASGQEPFGAIRYVLAARVRAHIAPEEPLTIAHYYLRAAWAARAMKDQRVERIALRDVLNRLNPAVEAATAKPARIRLGYLGGELSRRVGDFARAVDLLGFVEREADHDDPEGAFFGTLAQRQGALAIVMSDVNAVIPPGLRIRRANSREDDTADDDDGDSSVN